jgi:hypothetical protein
MIGSESPPFAVVTGGSSGIGCELPGQFAETDLQRALRIMGKE